MSMTSPAPSALNIDPAHAAILSLDVQSGIVSVYVKDASFVARAARLLHTGRTAGLAVVHVKVGFRPLVPEANRRNMFLSAVRPPSRISGSLRARAGLSTPTSASANAI
jgi:hypothetical protein